MEEHTLTKKQLAKLIFPIFAYGNPLGISNKYSKYVYSTIPLDFYPLISDYIKLYADKYNLENIKDINLIVDVEEYLNNPKYWLDQFIEEMNTSFNELRKNLEIDFKYGYIDIKYKIDSLSFLNDLNPKILQQLVHMRNWVLAEKQRKRIINEYYLEEIDVKSNIIKIRKK